MSVALYNEPYRAPAGALALAVHAIFFALLYFGFSWQAQPVATMSVELWQSLPDAAPPPSLPPPPKPEPVVEEPVRPPEPQQVAKPDIALPDKKKIERKPEPKKPEPKKTELKKPEPKKPQPVKQEPVKQVAPRPDTSAQDQMAREQAARDQAMRDQAAATGRVVDEYIGKIQGKIRRNIVMPPGVADDARAEFLVTLLPGGSVLKAELKKTSGNTSYDEAVERAILKSQPLPLPPDVAMFNRFRELRLGFKPKE